ncbi:MAG: site-2 protease family protein [Ruminococcaceae bacterium]|nr:site-2 protease family protein [Oscillospiraceae bacterium]
MEKRRKGFFGMRFSLLGAVAVAVLLFDPSGFCLMTLLAALLHECGHLLAAKWLGIPWRGFSMDFTGARMEVSGRMISFFEEWLLCAAGPFAGLLFAALGAIFWRETQWAVWFSCASLLLSLLNLLPIRGFDGGRMLECTLLSLLRESIVVRIMRLISFFFLFLLWASAIYFLLRAGDGISLLFFSMTLFSRFFDVCDDRFA